LRNRIRRQAEIKKRDSAPADLDSRAKCSKDARTWFNENWAGTSREKDTALLDFTNHYNKKSNKCFIFVEYHYNSNLAGPGGMSWTNHMSVWDVYENSKYGDFSEIHYTYWKPEVSTHNEVTTCEVYSQKCKTIDEFNGLARPYLND